MKYIMFLFVTLVILVSCSSETGPVKFDPDDYPVITTEP